jgi:hypothetical protein
MTREKFMQVIGPLRPELDHHALMWEWFVWSKFVATMLAKRFTRGDLT